MGKVKRAEEETYRQIEDVVNELYEKSKKKYKLEEIKTVEGKLDMLASKKIIPKTLISEIEYAIDIYEKKATHTYEALINEIKIKIEKIISKK